MNENQAPVPPLRAVDVTIAYRSVPVLQNVNFAAPAGSLTAIVGPNGAGKSTLIKASLGLIEPASGHFEFFGKSFREAVGRVSYVPQRTSVDWDFPVTALDVVCMGLYRKIGWLRPVRAKHRALAIEALQSVGMQDYHRRQISQLSGGQQQRVFLARALVQGADLFLMDEPLAGVDASTERTIIDVLRKLRDAGKTAMVVHHDLDTVADYFDRVLLLNQRVIADGSVADVMQPSLLKEAYGGKLLIFDHTDRPPKSSAPQSANPAR
ncbi:High-affinity zinc uptake system ATP-binding protein ZnuC [Rubripirellula lacrimiformis]|uniref:High-affinity zinc uptake system ATP-binding protein ZnuC n=1 Tax=Rubripirellula lacrimiformis TaxID=1930273 RepID=A0A517NHF9_9BACT|nr:metal ABC transporter ATP-binding protein [Rubripirellula lacrimiformis]QDT06518.1 High-affinity zinc uptake system ATP-binding protein ZnuC [Rubripirellula lacrimiformis]